MKVEAHQKTWTMYVMKSYCNINAHADINIYWGMLFSDIYYVCHMLKGFFEGWIQEKGEIGEVSIAAQ